MKDPDFQKARAAVERLGADPDDEVLVEMRYRAIKSYQLDLGKVYREGFEQGMKQSFDPTNRRRLSTRVSRASFGDGAPKPEGGAPLDSLQRGGS
jgi:hypothetical protein